MKKTIYILTALLMFTGCLDIKLESQFSDPDAITTVGTARELLASAYNSLPRFQYELSVLSDDFETVELSSKAADMVNLYKWQEKAIEELSPQIWTEYYLTISYINALIPRLDNVVTTGTEEEQELQKIRSEAKALKAMCYFDLLRIYAPNWSEADMNTEGIILKDRLELDFLPRSSMQKCAEEIETLLTEAARTDNSDAAVYYLSSDAIKALRAEFELYRGQYNAAISTGSELLTNAEEHWTSTAYNNLWSANESSERIFAPYIFNSFYTGLNYDTEKGDYFIVNGNISYEDSDIRSAWSCFKGPQTRNFGKYNKMFYDKTDIRYINTMRYSGVCFTVAEAYARNSQPDKAIALMNRYLAARNASLMDTGLSGDALIEAIMKEKQKEFLGEGTRWFDLKRMKADIKKNNYSGPATTVKSNDYRWLFPIPAIEYRYNHEISNINPGWTRQTVDD